VDGQTRTFVPYVGVEIQLLSSAALKEQTRELIACYNMPPDERTRAEELLDACTFDYEVVVGRDGIADILGLVIYTDAEHGRLFRDWADPEVCSCVMSALATVCPDLGSDRVVVLE
jgi:hypothetical protein